MTQYVSDIHFKHEYEQILWSKKTKKFSDIVPK